MAKQFRVLLTKPLHVGQIEKHFSNVPESWIKEAFKPRDIEMLFSMKLHDWVQCSNGATVQRTR